MKTSVRLLICLFPIVFTLNIGLSQNTNAHSIREKNLQKINLLSYKKSGDKFNSKNLYENIKGSPFYYEETQVADLVLHNGNVMEDVPFQIDLYAGEFIGTDKEGASLYLDLKYYKEIKVKRDGETDMFQRAHPSYPEKLIQVLHSDEHFVLIKMKNVKYVESSLINGGKREYVKKFNQTSSHDLIRDGEVIKIALKKKKFFKVFSKSEAKMMKEYAKEHNLSLKNENDFIQLLRYLNGQLS